MEALRESLDEILGSAPNPELLKDAVALIDGTELLSGLRARAKSDAHFAGELAQRTYRHPNGFVRIAVCELSHGGMLRLHQWQHPVETTTNDFHDHRGGFASKLITGRLLNEEFRLAVGDSYRRYDDIFEPPVHHLVARGTVGLVLDDARILCDGDVYYLSADVIHRSSPLSPHRTTTIVIEDRARRDRSTVVRPRDGRNLVPTISATVSIPELIEILEGLD